MTERIVWTTPSAMSSVNTYMSAPVRVVEHRARLAVDLVQLHRDAQPRSCAARAPRQAADAVAADDRARPGRTLAAAVAVHDDIGGEQLDQAVHVAVVDGLEEALGELVALPPATPRSAACSSTWRRARTASWRQLSSLLPTIAAISS